MTRPKELVMKALRAGVNTTADGVAWLREQEGYTMKSQTFGQLASRIRREAPGVAKVEVDPRAREMELASIMRDVLKAYTAEEVTRMVSIVQAVLKG